MTRSAVLAAILASALLAGCSSQEEPAAPAAAAPEPLHIVMKTVMEPHAETVWNIMSAAYNDVGDALDPAKLGTSDWQQIGESAQLMKDRAETLATVQRVLVSDGREPIMGGQDFGQKGPHGEEWDPVNAAVVQKRIDAQPDLFRQKARTLVEAADTMGRAAKAKDARLFYRVATELDEVCDGCHEVFWGTDVPPAPKQKLPGGESMTAQQ